MVSAPSPGARHQQHTLELRELGILAGATLALEQAMAFLLH